MLISWGAGHIVPSRRTASQAAQCWLGEGAWLAGSGFVAHSLSSGRELLPVACCPVRPPPGAYGRCSTALIPKHSAAQHSTQLFVRATPMSVLQLSCSLCCVLCHVSRLPWTQGKRAQIHWVQVPGMMTARPVSHHVLCCAVLWRVWFVPLRCATRSRAPRRSRASRSVRRA